MSRIDVVGLSLAEIALVLLFCFFAVLAPTYARLNKKYQAANAESSKAAEVQKKLNAMLAENELLKRELEGFRRNLRSTATPSCVEIGKASDWLFVAVIRGADQYEIGGNMYSLSSLAQRYSGALAEAKKNGCIHRIKIYYGNGVSLTDYDYALRRIEQSFYDTKLGPETAR